MKKYSVIVCLFFAFVTRIYAIYGFDEKRHEFQSVVTRGEISSVSKFIDISLINKIGINFGSAVNPKWSLSSYKELACIYEDYGVSVGVLATVVAETVSNTGAQEVVIMYWIYRGGQWSLLNFPFSGAHIPDQFPFSTKSVLEILQKK